MSQSAHKSFESPWENIQIPATDGFLLSGRQYFPTGDSSPENLVVICSGIGGEKEKYHSFARFLSSNGSRVIIFDFRGMGGSLLRELKHSDAKVAEWGSKDLSGVIDWASDLYSDQSIFLVAHSVNAQIIGLAANCRRIKGFVLVACSNGYWGLLGRGSLFSGLCVISPLLTKISNYFPSKTFGLGENLPAGVARDWGRNCDRLYESHPSARERLGEINVPVLAYSFDDDVFATRLGVRRLLGDFPNASKQWNHIAPKDLSLKSIGHDGFFRDSVKQTLWADTCDWLNGCSGVSVDIKSAAKIG